jgi:hypothetical protein
MRTPFVNDRQTYVRLLSSASSRELTISATAMWSQDATAPRMSLIMAAVQ